MEKHETINNFGNDVLDLIEKYKDQLEPYEVGHQLISMSTLMLLRCAPNDLVAIKIILSCVEIGICSYQEDKEKHKES